MPSRFEGLCIGGPYDGKRYAHDAPNFVVLMRPSPPMHIEQIQYVIDHIETKEGQVTFWKPTGQTTFETMRLLIDSYRPNANEEP